MPDALYKPPDVSIHAQNFKKCLKSFGIYDGGVEVATMYPNPAAHIYIYVYMYMCIHVRIENTCNIRILNPCFHKRLVESTTVGSALRLYKAPTDHTKPRQTIQSPNNSIQRDEILDKAPKRLYKDLKYFTKT